MPADSAQPVRMPANSTQSVRNSSEEEDDELATMHSVLQELDHIASMQELERDEDPRGHQEELFDFSQSSAADYSTIEAVSRFIQAFNKDNYDRLVVGCFTLDNDLELTRELLYEAIRRCRKNDQ